jgi:hypothetical protein
MGDLSWLLGKNDPKASCSNCGQFFTRSQGIDIGDDFSTAKSRSHGKTGITHPLRKCRFDPAKSVAYTTIGKFGGMFASVALVRCLPVRHRGF